MYFDVQKVGWEEVDKFRGGVEGAFFYLCAAFFTFSLGTIIHCPRPRRKWWDIFQSGLVGRKDLNKNELNQVADQQFLLKQWVSEGAHCKLKKLGSGHWYLRVFCWK